MQRRGQRCPRREDELQPASSPSSLASLTVIQQQNGSLGRLVEQATGTQESFTQGWTYTQLGKIDTETYPNCAPTFTACSGTRNVASQNLYTNGFLTGVNGFTAGAGITYYPNGMVSSVTHPNGVTSTYGLDPNGMPRPASITATGPASTLWSTGPYAYDGAGNVTQMGHAGYDLYDGVSRLTTAVVQTNAVDNPTPAANATVSQSVSYDAFGNIQAFLGSPGNSTPTDPRSNQLTGGTYDASGNLRSWNGASYDYDELNQLKHYVNGAEQWFYMYDADGERVWQFQPGINGLARFDRWTLRGLDSKVRRTFELYNYAWGNAWGGSNLWEDYVYRGGPLLASSYSDGYQRHVDVDHLGTPRLITGRASGQTGGFYTLTPCRILDTRQTGAPLTQTNPQHVYQISSACGVPANAQAVALNFTLVNATTNLSVQGYPGDLPAPGAPGTNVVSASPPGTAVIAGAAVLPLATDGSGTLGVLMTLAPPATSGQTDLILDVSGYFAPASTASVVAYHAYLPFGAEATYFAQDFERMKFTGHERDLADPSSPADDLDYMHARHYNYLTGRFLSADLVQGSPKRPQTWNRYAYAVGNPMRMVDPDGKCAVPTGLSAGQVGFCFEAYIATSHIGVIGLGDDRGPVANDPSASARASLKIIVDPKTGQYFGVMNPGESDVFVRGFGRTGSINVSAYSGEGKDDSHHYSFLVSARNGLSALNNLGDIGFMVNVGVDAAGNVTRDPGSVTKGYPSIEGYAYKMVEGEVVIQVLFTVQEQDPSNLNGPMNVPLLPFYPPL